MSYYPTYPSAVKFSEIAALEVFCALIAVQTHASFEDLAKSAVVASRALLMEIEKGEGK